MTALELARESARFADNKKGEKIVIMDVHDLSSITDYLVILSGQSEPHLKAIRNEIEAGLKKLGVDPRRIDGVPNSQWIVMDYIDVVIHIFDENTRDFYSLERLWGDGRIVAE